MYTIGQQVTIILNPNNPTPGTIVSKSAILPNAWVVRYNSSGNTVTLQASQIKPA